MTQHPALAEGRVAVITGGASGIGFAAAKRFAALGMKICLADLSEEALDRAGPGLGGSKTRLVWPSPGQSSPRVGEVVQRGEAEIGIQPISELMEVAGIDVVEPLPAALQSPDLVYMAGSPAAKNAT
jgi:NAD(P)-dependent dehydrogenase (short-subunit alcohol dehydrogenase family)